MRGVALIFLFLLLVKNISAKEKLEFTCQVKENSRYLIRINLYPNQINNDVIDLVTLKNNHPFWFLTLNSTNNPNIFRDIASDNYYIFNLEKKILTQKDVVSKKIIQLWHFVNCNDK